MTVCVYINIIFIFFHIKFNNHYFTINPDVVLFCLIYSPSMITRLYAWPKNENVFFRVIRTSHFIVLIVIVWKIANFKSRSNLNTESSAAVVYESGFPYITYWRQRSCCQAPTRFNTHRNCFVMFSRKRNLCRRFISMMDFCFRYNHYADSKNINSTTIITLIHFS